MTFLNFTFDCYSPFNTMNFFNFCNPAMIGNLMNSTVREDVNVSSSGTLSALGRLSISDSWGQAFFAKSWSSSGNLGQFCIDACGNYSYVVKNSAVQYLREGETKLETFTVQSYDGSTKQVTFTIVGKNDIPMIGDPTRTTVSEDSNVNNMGQLTATGCISISDADWNQGYFTGSTGAAGNLGKLTLAANGTYTYAVSNAAVQYLGQGQIKVDTFTVTSADGTTKQVAYTVVGVNDKAVIGEPTVKVVTEDVAVSSQGKLVASGVIAISDADSGEARFTGSTSVAGNLGSLTLAADGTYSYSVADDAVQSLANGATKVDTFIVMSVDGTTKHVAFTIVGTNDAAVIGSPTVNQVAEDLNVVNGSLSAKGTISISDVDRDGASFLTSTSGAADNLGMLTLSADGSYSYDVDNARVQYLGAGVTKIDTFTVTSFDGTTKQVAFTIVGTNDAAVIGSPTVHQFTEDLNVVDGFLLANGTISIADADRGEALLLTSTSGAADNLGTLALTADGSYSYTVDNAKVQYLGAGESKVDTFILTSVEGTTKSVSFVINGTNDGPVANDDHFTVGESGAVVISVLANDTDVDGNALKVEILSQPVEGRISLDASGHVVFYPGLDFFRLSDGQSAEVSFDYKTLDGFGGFDTAKATILVEGSGLFVSPLQTATDTIALLNSQSATLTLGGPSQTGFIDGHIDLDLGLGPVTSNKKNIFYVVDISGSTNLKFAGTPVGDLNGYGGANTILDAQIAGLLKLNKAISDMSYSPDDVTVTVVPFNSSAGPADWVSSGPTPNLQTTTFDVGSPSIDAFLRTLDNGGGTNYEEALQAVIARLKILDPAKSENNQIYFLSDGEPNPVNSFGDEVNTLQMDYNAQISAIGVGSTVPLKYLDMIDNTNGAERVVTTDQLATALLKPPVAPAQILDVDIFVNGVELTNITADSLIRTPFGLTLDLDVTGLRPILGNSNEVVAVVEFADHTMLSVQLQINGVLPVSTNDFLI